MAVSTFSGGRKVAGLGRRHATSTAIRPTYDRLLTRNAAGGPPAASDSSMIGRVVEACTSATMSGDGASDVISHEAPTTWMRLPKFEMRLAVQIARKVR